MVMEMRQPAQMPTGGPAAMQNAAPVEIPADLAAHIRELEGATLQRPADQAAWVELGNLYFDTHQPQRSVGAYLKAVALGPVSADVWTDLGIMHRESGATQKALESFDAALKLDPRHENALYNKGVVQLHDAKDRAGALATWEKLAAANPQAKNPDGRLVRDMVADLKKS